MASKQNKPTVYMQLGEGFSRSQIIVNRQVNPKEPLLVVGLPGIGFVSKLAVDHLVKQLKAKRIATLYSPYFPNQVLALKSGRLRLFSMRLFYKKLKKRDIVFLKGDIQPLTVEGQYEVCAKALDYFRSLGGTEVVSMAGFATNAKPEKSPAIYCTTTRREKLAQYKKLGAKTVDRLVPIVGMAGLFPGLAKVYGLAGTCLLVETPGTAIDAKGASALVKLLSDLCGEKFETGNLEARARKAEEMIRKLGEQAVHAEEQKMVAELAPEDAIKRSESPSYIR